MNIRPKQRPNAKWALGAICALVGACAKNPDYTHYGVLDGAAGATVAQGSGGSGGPGGAGAGRPDPTLALTPPMGWNSWNKFQGDVNDYVVRQIADAMVSTGMAAAGYEYVIIDDTWQASRDAYGDIVPDAARFPDMKDLADYVHAKGLKFGIYSDRGTMTCGNRPGSYGHEAQDARKYASWGVDYLKYDNCSPSSASKGIEQDFRAMGDALTATGRPIVYSISAWWFYPWEASVGHLWRTTTDIEDNWTSIMSILNRNGGDTTRYGSCTTCPLASAGRCVVCDTALPEAAYPAPGLTASAGPGHWNDPDMLEVGNGGMSPDEYRAHFSLWAIMAAPLIAGNDLRDATLTTVEILTNPEVIAVDQDARGVQGKPVGSSTTLEAWVKPLSGAATVAVALLNRTEAAADITVTWSAVGLPSGDARVRDLWAKQDLGTFSNQNTAHQVPSHGVAMLKIAGP
jgi:alpha-galactosidase